MAKMPREASRPLEQTASGNQSAADPGRDCEECKAVEPLPRPANILAERGGLCIVDHGQLSPGCRSQPAAKIELVRKRHGDRLIADTFPFVAKPVVATAIGPELRGRRSLTRPMIAGTSAPETDSRGVLICRRSRMVEPRSRASRDL